MMSTEQTEVEMSVSMLRATIARMGGMSGSPCVAGAWRRIGLMEDLGDIFIVGDPAPNRSARSWVTIDCPPHLVRPWWAESEPGLARLARAVLRRPEGGEPFMQRGVEVTSLHGCASRLAELCRWERERRQWEEERRQWVRERRQWVRP